MSADQILLVIISGLGVFHGLALALFLWHYKRGKSVTNRILAALLLVLSFRIAKSVFLEFYTGLDIKVVFSGLGFVMAVGPLFYFFVRSCLIEEFKFKKQYYIHFLPATAGVVIGTFITPNHLESLPLLFFFTLFVVYYLHYLVYLILGFVLTSKSVTVSKEVKQLIRLIFYGLIVIWIAYVFNIFDDEIPYIIGPILYSIAAYSISFILAKKGYLDYVQQKKYSTTPISDEQKEVIFEKLLKMVRDDLGYKNSDISLTSLAESLHVSPQILSLVVNKMGGMNFNNYINQFRINEAIRLLADEEYKAINISAIAFEVGFNSISSFNTAFKKVTSKTPQGYRNQLLK